MPSMPREAGRRAVVGGDLRGVQVNVIGELAVDGFPYKFIQPDTVCGPCEKLKLEVCATRVRVGKEASSNRSQCIFFIVIMFRGLLIYFYYVI